MCGRYALKADPKVIVAQFDVAVAAVAGGVLADLESPTVAAHTIGEDAVHPNYNIAPTHRVAAITHRQDVTTLAAFSWGLVPSWAKDPAVGVKMINARAETVGEKPSYRKALAVRRCLVPANGWFEWQRTESAKQPYYFSAADGGLLAFAGIYERWQGPTGDVLWSLSVLTTQAWPHLADVHDRMPLLVSQHLHGAWLEPGGVDVAEFVAAAPAQEVSHWAVDKAVGSVRNNRPSLLDPVE